MFKLFFLFYFSSPGRSSAFWDGERPTWLSLIPSLCTKASRCKLHQPLRLSRQGTYAFRDRPSPRHLVSDPRPRPYGDYVFTETYGKAGRVLYCSRHELRLVPRA